MNTREDRLLAALRKTYDQVAKFFYEFQRTRNEISWAMAELSAALKDYQANAPSGAGNGADEPDLF